MSRDDTFQMSEDDRVALIGAIDSSLATIDQEMTMKRAAPYLSALKIQKAKYEELKARLDR